VLRTPSGHELCGAVVVLGASDGFVRRLSEPDRSSSVAAFAMNQAEAQAGFVLYQARYQPLSLSYACAINCLST
jgi:hypothetical protein